MNAWDFTTYFPGMQITAVAETASSWFLFTTDQVLKILKPLRRGPVDLSTVAARQKQLKSELDLLNHFNPGLADKVLPLKSGETVSEAALLMRRIPRGTNVLARLLTNRAGTDELSRIGNVLGKVHQKDVGPAKMESGWDTRTLRAELDEAVLPLLESNASMFLSHDTAMRVRDALHQILEENAGPIQERMRRKGVRRIHGNLQAGNVYVEDKQVYLLDPAREGDPNAYGDVLSDLGCIVKDVRIFAPADADALVRSYFGRAPSAAEVALLRLYELLWTLRRFLVHTNELSIGNGGPIDMELVQRYRQALTSAAVKPARTQHAQAPRNQHHAPQKHVAKPTPPAQKKPEPKKTPVKAAPVVKKHTAKPAPAKKHTPPKKQAPAKKKPAPKKPMPAKKAPAKKRPAPKKPVPAKKKQASKKHAPAKRQPKKKPAPKKAPMKKKPAPVKKKPAPKKTSTKRSGGIGDTLKGFLGLKKRR